MFVCCEPQIISWNKINSTYGVSKILALNKKPQEISNDVILVLKNKYEGNTYPIIKENLKKGDNIKFISGPFVDLIARIEALDDKNHIWILLEAMGQYRKLKMQLAGKVNYTKL